MGTYIQSYGWGYIAREGDKYQYVVNEKVVDTYDTVEALASAQGEHGKQDQKPESGVSEAVATKPVRKTRAKTKSAK